MSEKAMRLKGVALLYVGIKGWFGERRKKTENEQEDRLLKLLPPSYFEDINSIQSEGYNAVRDYTLPFPLRGVRAVPEALLPRAEEDLKRVAEKYGAAADKLCFNDYETAKREAQQNLGADFNEKNYPTPQQLRDKFKMTYTVFTVDASEAALSSALGVGDLLEQFQEEAAGALVSQFRETLAGMVDRLTEKEDGTKRRIHASSVEKFQQFVQDFSSLAAALSRDSRHGMTLTEAERLAQEAHALVRGLTPEQLRKDEALRASVQRELKRVSESLSVVEVGSRNILVD